MLGMKTDALNGQLDPLILATVAEEPAHGYAILQRLKDRSSGAFGLLSSAWSTGSGRRRRVYNLTRAGTSALEVRRREWKRFAHAIELVMG